MTLKKTTAIACGILLFYSCSSNQFAGVLGGGKKVVATEETISERNVSQIVISNTPAQEPVVRTLHFTSQTIDKSQVTENQVMLAGVALKDSSSLMRYSVVVGSYTQPEKSASFIEKLKQKSISPFFVLNEKGMYRLVAGTFDNKDDADYLGIKLDVSDIEFWILERIVVSQ